MEALHCANIVWYILNNHTFEVLAGKYIYIYIFIYIYTPIHGHIQRIFTNLLAPKPADNKIKWKEITYQQESYTQGIYKRCGYIILNIRNMFWTSVLRENVSIYMKLSI